MKLKLICSQCSKGNENENEDIDFVSVEVKDNGLYEFTCNRSHKGLVLLKNQKYEVLFEFGSMALLDGYTREAVASIAASLERFLEFYIKVILLKYNVPYGEFKEGWKKVASQSERQLGAFLFLYLLDNRKSVKFIEDKQISFRNNVIHKGYIPSFDEAVDYGDCVLKFIKNTLDELGITSKDQIKQVKEDYIFEILENAKVNFDSNFQKLSITSMFMTTTLNLAGFDLSKNKKVPVNFRDSLERLKETIGSIGFHRI